MIFIPLIDFRIFIPRLASSNTLSGSAIVGMPAASELVTPVFESSKTKQLKMTLRNYAADPNDPVLKGWKVPSNIDALLKKHKIKKSNLHTEEVKLTESQVISERGADAKGYYRSTESGAGLTRKGAKHFGIKTAVTTPPSKLKKGGKAWKRRKSFCARMSGMKGPMKDEKGRPTRKAMSLRRWNC